MDVCPQRLTVPMQFAWNASLAKIFVHSNSCKILKRHAVLVFIKSRLDVAVYVITHVVEKTFWFGGKQQ